MFEIKDEDLQLSEKFKLAQLNLETKKQEIIAINKKENNDTIEACLLFQSNVSYFKEKIKEKRVVDKTRYIVEYLLKDFPKANPEVLLRAIKKQGIYTYNQILLFVLFLFSIPYFLVNGYLLFYFGFSFNTVLNYCIPATLAFIVLFLMLDANIFYKK